MRFQFSDDLWEKISFTWGKRNINELDYPDDQVKEMMRFFFQVKRAAKLNESQRFNVHRAWKNVVSRGKLKYRRKLLIRIFRYAAVFILVVASCLLWYKFQQDTTRFSQVVTKDSILSGTRKAELMLANGKKVILDSASNIHEMEISGMKFVNDDENGQLRYAGSSAIENSDLVSYNMLCIPKGGEYSLQLPDGSRVWLNSETSIRFPVHFASNQRDVYLTGEAYFEVVKNASAPFHVHVENGEIVVLGTSFNVSAYKEDVIWQTTLVSGRVQVVTDDSKIEMSPTEQYSVDIQTGKGKLREVDTELFTSWVNGKFYFNAYTFEDIVRKLERWYDFKMIYHDEEIKQMRFSGTINKHRPLREMLQFLEKTTDIYFEISGKNITVSKMKKG